MSPGDSLIGSVYLDAGVRNAAAIRRERLCHGPNEHRRNLRVCLTRRGLRTGASKRLRQSIDLQRDGNQQMRCSSPSNSGDGRSRFDHTSLDCNASSFVPVVHLDLTEMLSIYTLTGVLRTSGPLWVKPMVAQNRQVPTPAPSSSAVGDYSRHQEGWPIILDHQATCGSVRMPGSLKLDALSRCWNRTSGPSRLPQLIGSCELAWFPACPNVARRPCPVWNPFQELPIRSLQSKLGFHAFAPGKHVFRRPEQRKRR